MSRATVEQLVYDPESHTSTCNGRPVPHVTAILTAAGMTERFDQLPRRSREAAHYRRGLGSVVHADCHAYDDDDLDWSTLAPESLPYVEAWATFRHNLGLQPTERERQVFDPLHWYTGILDGIFNDVTLVDIKIGDPRSAAADLQTAAYAQAYLRMEKRRGTLERMAVHLRPGRPIPYSIYPYERTDYARDFQKFLACRTVYDEQVARRGRARTAEEGGDDA